MSMVDPLPSLVSLKDSYKGLDKVKKNHIRLTFSILMLGMGLFFYFFLDPSALAQQLEENSKIRPDVVDPLNKIGKGMEVGCGENSSCENLIIEETARNNPKFTEMLAGYPMGEMVPFLSRRNEEGAAYLIAIAKKESDWGKHSPKKYGKNCYNYWGYRGTYNQTASGYSCFDTPEQAVDVVGGRIEDLLNKKVNTPERMVVWKCGSTCAGHKPKDVQKWISDVKYYFNKLK